MQGQTGGLKIEFHTRREFIAALVTNMIIKVLLVTNKVRCEGEAVVMDTEIEPVWVEHLTPGNCLCDDTLLADLGLDTNCLRLLFWEFAQRFIKPEVHPFAVIPPGFPSVGSAIDWLEETLRGSSGFEFAFIGACIRQEKEAA